MPWKVANKEILKHADHDKDNERKKCRHNTNEEGGNAENWTAKREG